MKVLFASMQDPGHINACIGVARILFDAGHEVVYAMPSGCDWLAKGYDWLKVEMYKDPDQKDGTENTRQIGEDMRKRAHQFQLSPMQRVEREPIAYQRFTGFIISNNENIMRIIDRHKPDLIMMDFYVEVPAVITSGIPWVLIFSANPLRAYGKYPNAMPRSLGFSIHDPVEKFEEVRKVRQRVMKEARSDYCEWLKSQGISNPDSSNEMALFSPHLNVYSYPEDLDYKELGPIPEKFFRLDHCVRPISEDGSFQMDQSILDFINSDGKKIYFSLGSMASAQVELMKRLISIMAKCPHKFIISKGVFHDEIELPCNMVGAKYLNQLKILPHVDLVITHGGNNTFVESLYFGKKIIVLPLFGDQPDNGRRLEDLKLGRMFPPWTVEEDELLEAIEELLNDDELEKTMTKIGEKIRSSESGKKLVDTLVEMVDGSKRAK